METKDTPGKVLVHQELVLSLLSGFLIGIAMRYCHNFIFLLWIGFIPLFYSLQTATMRQVIVYSLMAGIGNSLFALSWLIPTATAYMGQSFFFGILIFIIASLLFSIKFVLFGIIYKWLVNPAKRVGVLNVLLVPSVWVGIEFLNSVTTASFPWSSFYVGYTLANLPLFIQVAEFTGVFGVSFLIVSINYLLYLAVSKRSIAYLSWGAGLLLVQLVFGYILINSVSDSGREIRISIIQENIPAELRWDDSVGDEIVEKYYLNPLRKAVKYNPDIILWSETAIPWRLYMDDALIYKALEITWPAQAGHMLGIHSNVPKKPDMTYNSAYYIHPDGAITGKYDKVYPLAVLEAPVFKDDSFGGVILPFFKKSVDNIEPGENSDLLETPYGNIGMSICNESVLGFHARRFVKAGANFLMVMSNDAWFRGTFFPDFHFSHIPFRLLLSSKVNNKLFVIF